jgi:hypothetical protein
MVRRRSLHPKGHRTRAAVARTVTSARRTVGPVEGVRADLGPTAAMLEPIRALAAFMATLPAGHPAMFAPRGVTIIENFPPYLFAGRDAAARWEEGFRRHAADGALTDLAVTFGRAQDFGVSGSRAFFVLPTTWAGRAAGVPFEERGGWSFVLAPARGGWKIRGYAWGVTSIKKRPQSHVPDGRSRFGQ